MLNIRMAFLIFIFVLSLYGCSEETEVESGKVSGTITNNDDGIFIEDVMLVINGREATSNSVGFYEFSNIPVGLQAITASLSGYEIYSGEISLDSSLTIDHDISLVSSDNMWELAYENNSSGVAISGSLLRLMESFSNGASIRVHVVSYNMMLNPTYCKIDSLGTYFMCQARFHGADDKALINNIGEVDMFTTNGERLYKTYKKNGEFVAEKSERVSLKWYVEK